MEAKATIETLSEMLPAEKAILPSHEFDRNAIWMEIGVVLSLTAIPNLWYAIAALAWLELGKKPSLFYEYSTM
ncbi:MAG: hypothetical protein ACRENG_24315, partial [bacterium]